MSKHVAKIQDLEEFKLEKCSEEKEIKKKQKKLDQKLKKVHEREANLKLGKLEINPKSTMSGGNRNEPNPEEENKIIPSIPASNFYDIFSEAEITSDDTVKADLVVEERLQKVSAETNNIIEENKFGNDIFEEAITKTREKFIVRVQESVRDKLKAREASDIFTDDEIIELETELLDELELEATHFIETESWEEHLIVFDRETKPEKSLKKEKKNFMSVLVN